MGWRHRGRGPLCRSKGDSDGPLRRPLCPLLVRQDVSQLTVAPELVFTWSGLTSACGHGREKSHPQLISVGL
eukprot:scaffold6476_cov26-Tisochrysis_lutea.AAC.1